MLPEVPVEAGGEVGEDRFGAREDVGRHVGIAVDVDPERNLAESAGVVGDVLDRAARGPLLFERVGSVAVCEAPPVALERREHHGVARSLGGLARHAGVFDRRLVAGVLLALHEEVLDAGFGVFGDEVESVRAKEEPGDHRTVAEVGAAEGTRLGGALREELRTVVVRGQHHVARAVGGDAVEAREGSRDERPFPRAVCEGDPPGLGTVRPLVDRDGGVQHAAFAAERHVAPDERDRGVRLGAFAHGGLVCTRRHAFRAVRAIGELSRPEVAAAGRERGRTDLDAP